MNESIAQIVAMAAALALTAGVSLAGDAPATAPTSQTSNSGPVTVRFWGHACFTITAAGKTLLLDPYSPKVGYKPFAVTPDLVLITHEHFDHNDTSWLTGKGLILHGLDEGQVQQIDRRVGLFHVRTVASKHWSDPAFAQRGNNTIFMIEAAGLKFVHLGDLGEKLSPKQIEVIGRPDVLMIPVGGFYTIDAAGALDVVHELKPKAYVLPMHYRTSVLESSLQSQLAEPSSFLRHFGEKVLRIDGNELTVNPAAPPKEPMAVSMGYLPAADESKKSSP